MILPDTSPTMPSYDILTDSNMVKIVIWGGIPVKLGILSILFQGKFSVEIFIKEGERWSKDS